MKLLRVRDSKSQHLHPVSCTLHPTPCSLLPAAQGGALI